MDEIIKRHRAMVAERLAQGFSPVHRDTLSKAQEEFDDIEKARVVRQDGDIHPNGKWVWSSQAAGGKGDWRVIKKPKDGSPAPAPAKKETKSANAPALSSEALMKTLENMSAEDLIKLQSLIANAVAKKIGGNKTEAPIPAAPEVSEPAKRYNIAPDGSPIDLTKLPDQNIITAVVLVQENVDKLAYEATLGGGKKKQEKIAQELEDQRGKLAELQEEADRRGLKNEPSKKVDDEEHTPQTYGHEVFDREAADKYLKCSAEEVNQFQGEYDAVSVIKMTKQDQRDWNEDYGFDLEPDKYPNEFIWMVEQGGSYFLFDNEKEAMACATAILDNDGNFASGMGFDEVSTDGTHTKVNKLDADKAFSDEVKRVVDASALKDPASKSGAVEMLTAAKERFGDKLRVELHNPSRNPTAIVDFGNGLELGFSYRNDGYTYTFWKLSGYEEEFSMELKERGFDVRNYNDSPRTRLDAEINNTRENLRRSRNEDDEFVWTVNLNRLKAIKNKLEREFKAFRL